MVVVASARAPLGPRDVAGKGFVSGAHANAFRPFEAEANKTPPPVPSAARLRATAHTHPGSRRASNVHTGDVMTKGRREGRARDSAGRPLVVVWRSFLNRTGRDTREEFIKKSIKKSSSRSPARARDGLSLAVVSRHLGGGGGTSALGTYVGPRSNPGVSACACAERAGTGRGGGAARVSATGAALFSVTVFSPFFSRFLGRGRGHGHGRARDDACDACAVGIDGWGVAAPGSSSSGRRD